MIFSSGRSIICILIIQILIMISVKPGWALERELISGTVFHDMNKNGQLDVDEPGIQGVLVSNGREIVVSDEEGNFELVAEDNAIYFVVKPRNWTTAVDKNGIPRFYHINSTEGAGGKVYQGLEATGKKTKEIDFALYPQEESDEFRVLVFGDTQPRDLNEVSYIANDSVQELIGVDAAFGTTLGDLVHNDLDLMQSVNEVVGQIGIPWRHIIGNHDIDHSADTNWDVRGSYMRTYGPSWYAFNWGGTHFVAVDNIRWIVDGEERNYRTGLGNDQMKFIENYLAKVPDDELVVFLMHIPWVNSTGWANENERNELFKLLASHPHTVSFAAHTHRHYHEMIGSEYGWPTEQPHHMVSMGAVCGSWWTGAPDEYGIPHSLMQDGTPTGYAFLDIKGNDWKLNFKAARRPSNFQLHIAAPDEIEHDEIGNVDVFANVFNALPDAKVEMRIADNSFESSWQTMNQVEQIDPVYDSMKGREDNLEKVSWRRVGNAYPNARHLWKSTLPEDLEPGTYTIFVRSKDKWNEYDGRRIIRVVE